MCSWSPNNIAIQCTWVRTGNHVDILMKWMCPMYWSGFIITTSLNNRLQLIFPYSYHDLSTKNHTHTHIYIYTYLIIFVVFIIFTIFIVFIVIIIIYPNWWNPHIPRTLSGPSRVSFSMPATSTPARCSTQRRRCARTGPSCGRPSNATLNACAPRAWRFIGALLSGTMSTGTNTFLLSWSITILLHWN